MTGYSYNYKHQLLVCYQIKSLIKSTKIKVWWEAHNCMTKTS